MVCNCISGNLKLLTEVNIEDTEMSYETSDQKFHLFSLLLLMPALPQTHSEDKLSCQCAMGTSAFPRRGNLITSPKDLPWEFSVWNGALK